jgi:tetratricopeptide (TPR) repeat protein
MSLGDLLTNVISGFLSNGAAQVVPDQWKRRAKSKLADWKFWEQIKGNHDLTRAFRLAWIVAAKEVLKEARRCEPQDRDVRYFSEIAYKEFDAIRWQMDDRRAAISPSPMDRHLQEVLIGVAEYIDPAGVKSSPDTLNHNFVDVLSELTGLERDLVPNSILQIASAGVVTKNYPQPRPFNELVFAAVAEIFKDPKDNPQAREAFYIHQQHSVRLLCESALDQLKGLDAKIDLILSAADPLTVCHVGMEYLQLLPGMQLQLNSIEAKMDKLEKTLDTFTEAADIFLRNSRLIQIGLSYGQVNIAAKRSKEDEAAKARTRVGQSPADTVTPLAPPQNQTMYNVLPWDGVSAVRFKLSNTADQKPVRLEDNSGKAIKALTDALARDPNNASLLYSLGIIYRERGEFRPAIQSLEAALKVDDSLQEARAGIALCYWQLRDLPRAAQYVEMLDKLESGVSDRRTYVAMQSGVTASLQRVLASTAVMGIVPLKDLVNLTEQPIYKHIYPDGLHGDDGH